MTTEGAREHIDHAGEEISRRGRVPVVRRRAAPDRANHAREGRLNWVPGATVSARRRARICCSTPEIRSTGTRGATRRLAGARDEDKPILLSVGYSACHWCHVMERESFEDAGTAALMNEHFVSVKVDREERPDIDAIYMDAVVALTGQGGWPMTRFFLTPDGELHSSAGRIFPPERRFEAAELQRRAARDRRELAGAAREGRPVCRRRLREAPPGSAARNSSRRRRIRPMRCSSSAVEEASGRGSSRSGEGGEARRSFRRQRRSSSCCAAASGRWSRGRSTAWPRAGCTTSSEAGSTATRSTSAGSCRTSRRCSTTTRGSWP